MFESDDYDQILSQFDFPDIENSKQKTCDKVKECTENHNKANTVTQTAENTLIKTAADTLSKAAENTVTKTVQIDDVSPIIVNTNSNSNGFKSLNIVSPKHTKRKIIDSHFDHKTKRKFPGPAGLLTGNFQESKDESLCHMELLSQDIAYSQNNLRKGSFELPLWNRLLEDVKKLRTCEVDTIKEIKIQALAGNLQQRKAQIVTAFVETVDRSATDPLIVVRDTTGSIKGTLHRDAWTAFSPYIVSEYCALVLWKPTVLTTGSAFKKHYLNITLSNIYGIYSSTVLQDIDFTLPDNYVRNYDDEFTIIKATESPENLGINLSLNAGPISNGNDLLDGLDSIFSDDVF